MPMRMQTLQWRTVRTPLSSGQLGTRKEQLLQVERARVEAVYPDLLRMDIELPDLIEFEAFEDILPQPPIEKKVAVKRGICLTESREYEVDVKKFVFICRVCKKAFSTLKTCENHILNKGHVYPLIGLRYPGEMNTQETANGCVSFQTPPPPSQEMDRRALPDFLPVHFGKWSKVICELRHRFGQVTDSEPIKPKNGWENPWGKQIETQDVTQTQPKAAGPDINETVKLLNECFQTKALPLSCTDRAMQQGQLEPESPSPTPNGVFQECSLELVNGRRSVADSPVDDSVHPYSLVPKEAELVSSSRISPNGEKNTDARSKHRIGIDFQSKLLFCQSCGVTFPNFEEAAEHWSTSPAGDNLNGTLNTMNDRDLSTSGFSEECDFEPQTLKSSAQLVQPSPAYRKCVADELDADLLKIREGGEIETAVGNASPDYEEETQLTGEDSAGVFTNELPSTTEVEPKDAKEIPVFVGEKEKLLGEDASVLRLGKSSKKRGRKKKNKPWRMVKRAFILTLTFLF